MARISWPQHVNFFAHAAREPPAKSAHFIRDPRLTLIGVGRPPEQSLKGLFTLTPKITKTI